MKKAEVYKKLLSIAKVISKTREGGLIIIGPEKKFAKKYDFLYPQLIKKFNIDEDGIDTLLEKVITLDGAITISEKGDFLAYGAKIKKTNVVLGFGTKNAAASGITTDIKEATAILISEGIDWIRIYQKGGCVLEMDSSETTKSIKDKIISFLTDRDTALVTTAGASAAVLGFAPILLVGGTYLVIKTATGIIKKNIKENNL